MNVGNLNISCSIRQLAAERGTAGEVLSEREPWKEIEKMMLGRFDFGGRALPTGDREASSIEAVFEGWARLHVVKPGMRLVAEEIEYTITRVDPARGRQWMLVYCVVVK